jgi:PilZ domain
MRVQNRRSPRARISRKFWVRPSDSDGEHFEEFPISANVSKHGIYFYTSLRYQKGMRLFVTYPFTFANDPIKSEYIAEVVRVEELPNDRFGVAIHLLDTI